MTAAFPADSLREVARLLRRLPGRTTLPILEQVLVTVAGSSASFVVTDLDIAIVARIDLAGPSIEGSFTVPRTELVTLARHAAKGSTVRFTTTEKQGRIDYTNKTLASSREYLLLDPTEFPPLPEVEDRSFILQTTTLDAIRLSRKASSNDETRYVLNGILLDPRDGGVVVASDGRRMAMTPARVPHDEAIIPNAVADLLVDPWCDGAAVWRRNSDAEEDKPGCMARLIWNGGKVDITFRLIDGSFPNYRQIIPPLSSRRASYTFAPSTAAALIDWLRAHPKDCVSLSREGPMSLLVTRYSMKGESKSSVTVPAAIDGEPPSVIAFNPLYLADALGMGLHTLDLIDEISPAVATNGHTRYVVVPMRSTAPASTPEPADGDEEEAESEDPEEGPAAEEAEAPLEE